jgi:hypothetical protein
MAIVIAKLGCQHEILLEPVSIAYFLKVVDLCYGLERELTDKYPTSALDLYIAMDMGTWVVGAWRRWQVAHPACDYTHWWGMNASMLHQIHSILAVAVLCAVSYLARCSDRGKVSIVVAQKCSTDPAWRMKNHGDIGE